MQDNRSRFLHNEGARRANEVRQRRATVENPQWAMSRPAEWYKNKENLASVRDTLSQVRGNRDFFTTDQDESRSMYQMILNNMYADALGPVDASKVFHAAADSFGITEDILDIFRNEPKPTIH